MRFSFLLVLVHLCSGEDDENQPRPPKDSQHCEGRFDPTREGPACMEADDTMPSPLYDKFWMNRRFGSSSDDGENGTKQYGREPEFLWMASRYGPKEKTDKGAYSNNPLRCNPDTECSWSNKLDGFLRRYRILSRDHALLSQTSDLFATKKQLQLEASMRQLKCQVGWVAFGSSCYKFINEYQPSLEAAKQTCRDLDSKIVEIESLSEADFLQRQADLIYDISTSASTFPSDCKRPVRPEVYPQFCYHSITENAKTDMENCVKIRKAYEGSRLWIREPKNDVEYQEERRCRYMFKSYGQVPISIEPHAKVVRRRFAWSESETAHRIGGVNYYIGAYVNTERRGKRLIRRVYPMSKYELKKESNLEVPKDIVEKHFLPNYFLLDNRERIFKDLNESDDDDLRTILPWEPYNYDGKCVMLARELFHKKHQFGASVIQYGHEEPTNRVKLNFADCSKTPIYTRTDISDEERSCGPSFPVDNEYTDPALKRKYARKLRLDFKLFHLAPDNVAQHKKVEVTDDGDNVLHDIFTLPTYFWYNTNSDVDCTESKHGGKSIAMGVICERPAKTLEALERPYPIAAFCQGNWSSEFHGIANDKVDLKNFWYRRSACNWRNPYFQSIDFAFDGWVPKLPLAALKLPCNDRGTIDEARKKEIEDIEKFENFECPSEKQVFKHALYTTTKANYSEYPKPPNLNNTANAEESPPLYWYRKYFFNSEIRTIDQQPVIPIPFSTTFFNDYRNMTPKRDRVITRYPENENLVHIFKFNDAGMFPNILRFRANSSRWFAVMMNRPSSFKYIRFHGIVHPKITLKIEFANDVSDPLDPESDLEKLRENSKTDLCYENNNFSFPDAIDEMDRMQLFDATHEVLILLNEECWHKAYRFAYFTLTMPDQIPLTYDASIEAYKHLMKWDKDYNMIAFTEIELQPLHPEDKDGDRTIAFETDPDPASTKIEWIQTTECPEDYPFYLEIEKPPKGSIGKKIIRDCCKTYHPLQFPGDYESIDPGKGPLCYMGLSDSTKCAYEQIPGSTKKCRSNEKISLCPFDFPFPYMNGERCCSERSEGVNEENVMDPKCNGKMLRIDSECCGAKSVRCPKRKCVVNGHFKRQKGYVDFETGKKVNRSSKGIKTRYAKVHSTWTEDYSEWSECSNQGKCKFKRTPGNTQGQYELGGLQVQRISCTDKFWLAFPCPTDLGHSDVKVRKCLFCRRHQKLVTSERQPCEDQCPVVGEEAKKVVIEAYHKNLHIYQERNPCVCDCILKGRVTNRCPKCMDPESEKWVPCCPYKRSNQYMVPCGGEARVAARGLLVVGLICIWRVVSSKVVGE